MDDGDVKPGAEPSIPLRRFGATHEIASGGGVALFGGRKLHHWAVVDSGWRLYAGESAVQPRIAQ
nr:hypothetical protein [Escherichia coli]